MRWVGRPLPLYEDPVLLQGRGRYTADLARDARILRFVRSPVARGHIQTVNAPPEIPVITASVLGDVKPIFPRLDRPDYVPVAQPILAREGVNYAGEPIAAVIGATSAEAEDLAEQVTVEIAAETPVVTLDDALAPDAPLVHDTAARNTLIDTHFETSALLLPSRRHTRSSNSPSPRAGRQRCHWKRAAPSLPSIRRSVALPSGLRRKCRICCVPELPMRWGSRNPSSA